MSAVRATSPDKPPRSEVAARLARVLPAASVLVDREDLKPYECDGLSAYRATPLVAAIPADEREVAAVLAVARETKTCRWWRAAPAPGYRAERCRWPTASCCRSRSSSGSSTSIRSRASRACSRGCAISRISEAAAPLGLYYAPDPSSQIACSIGGNVAENSGGVHCLKYGLTVHNVLKRARRSRSTATCSSSAPRRSMRPATTCSRCATGSEGLLGVIARSHREAAAQARDRAGRDGRVSTTWRSAGEAVGDDHRRRHHPRGPRDDGPARHRARSRTSCMRATTSRPQAILLAESDGTREEVADEIGQDDRGDAARAGRPTSRSSQTRPSGCASGRGARPRSRRWAASRPITTAWTAPSRAGALAPRAAAHRGAVARDTGCAVANVFHAGDGNLHPLILYDANVPGELRAHRGIRRRDPRDVHRGGRHHHRRARRGHREDQPDVRAVQPRRSSRSSTR